MDIETLLQEEIVSELETLKDLEKGGTEYKATVDGLTKLIDRAIEMDKYNIEREDKTSEREFEREQKLNQMEEEKREREFEREYKLTQMKEDKIYRWVDNVLKGLGIGLPLAVTVWGTLKSLKFEETGTVTTPIGRGFISKLIHKK